MIRSLAGIAVFACLWLPPNVRPVLAQATAKHRGVVVIATGADAIAPVPNVEPSGTNYEVTNLLFLRLAELGLTLSTVGDRGFTPMLARSWSRRDSLTIVFELDPRAIWHDGEPVKAQDVVFTFERARQVPDLVTALRRVQSVTADGPRRVTFRFTQAYGEQVYDATYHMLILPSHLLASVPQDSLAGSAFARNPVGNGAFRWVRRVPGQLIELEAFDRFFLGRPKLNRVYYRVASDADARLNLVLSGEADATQAVSLAGQARVRADSAYKLIPVIGPGINYALFNQRTSGDRSRPHPIFTDPVVRRALVLALDRETMVRAVHGGYASVPDGPVPQTFIWVEKPGHRIARPDTARARAMLASAGWIDHDGDGILDKNGIRFEVTVNTPNVTPQRILFAQQMQARLRELGIRLNVEVVEWSVFQQRRNDGQFDIDMAYAQLDPTPSGWRNSWSCATAGKPRQNVGSYCNPKIDSLLERAAFARDPVPLYREILRTIREDAPAIFLSAPSVVVAVHRRYRDHPLRPESLWLSLHQWSLAQGRQLARDRGER